MTDAWAALAHWARTRANDVAVEGAFGRWTWQALWEATKDLASVLDQAGIGSGCRVSMEGLNAPAWLVAITAVAARKAVLVPVNSRWSALEQETWRIRAGVSGRLMVPADEDSLMPEWHPAEMRRDAWAKELATLMATSGSTGTPQGIGLTAGAHAAHARAHAEVLRMGPEDRVLVVLPLFHIGGLNAWWRALASGHSLVLLPRFTVAAVADALERHAPTMASLTGTMVRDLVGGGVRPAPSLRVVLAGGEPLPTGIMRHWPVVRASYGMTETCGHVAIGRAGADDAEVPGGELKVQPGTRLDLVDEEHRPVHPGEEGRIRVQGPTVCAGRLDERGSWIPHPQDVPLLTGDRGRLGASGGLVVRPRPGDLILSGGENVSPAEIEAVLEQVPGVAAALVAPVPDARWGQRPAALVVAKSGCSEDQLRAALDEALQNRLGGYKRPAFIRFVAALPVLESGKRDRRGASRMLMEEC